MNDPNRQLPWPQHFFSRHTSPGDDMVVQPDGDWVHVEDGGGDINAHSPFPPHGVTGSSPFKWQDLFNAAGLPIVFGTRATSCPSTGDVYTSASACCGSARTAGRSTRRS